MDEQIDVEQMRVDRTLKVILADWLRWKKAAAIMRVSVVLFVTAACNKAAATIFEKHGIPKELLSGDRHE